MDNIHEQNVKSKFEIEYELAVLGISLSPDIRSDNEVQKNIFLKDESINNSNTKNKTETLDKFNKKIFSRYNF